MKTHDGVKYKIEPIEVEIATGRDAEHCETKWGYTYTLIDIIETYCGYDDYESDEWYETENEAKTEAENMIDKFHDGQEYEGSYEERMAMRPRDIDWDERRRMGE